MAADTDIANLALGRLGVSQAIASLTEQSTPARICARFYDQCRQEVLRAHPWACATTCVALAEVEDQDFPGWEFVYGYPSNCLMVHAVADESGIRQSQTLICAADWDTWSVLQQRLLPWQTAMRTDGASQVLLSDFADAWAFFTYDATNVGLFTPDLRSVIAWRLAMEVGGPLKAKADMIQYATQSYGLWLNSASAQSMNEGRDDRTPDSESISCRM